MAAPAGDLEQGDHALVATDGDAHLRRGGLDAEDQHGRSAGSRGAEVEGAEVLGEGLPALRPRPARRRDRDPPRRRRRCASWSPAGSPTQLEAHFEMVAERRRHDVAPLDDDDPAELGELAEGEVGDLVELLEAIDVGVVELASRVAYVCTSVNVGDVIGSATPSALPKPWANAVLPAPISPARTTMSPAPAAAGDGRGDGVGGGERRRDEGHGGTHRSPRCYGGSRRRRRNGGDSRRRCRRRPRTRSCRSVAAHSSARISSSP